MRRLVKNEQGSVLVMATMLVTMSLLVAAMVLDLGRVWIARARLQAASDAAALAAVQCATVEAEKELRDVVVTEFFHVSDSVPPEDSIKDKEPRYDEDGTLTGWWITYVKEKQEEVVGWRLVLDPAVASASASETLLRNAWTWDDDAGVTMPIIESERIESNGKSVSYGCTVRARVESVLMGPLLASVRDDLRYRFITVRFSSESTVTADQD